MIDMNSSDSTCIYSTLMFFSEHARRHEVTPIITFDQPLWWKALMIIKSEPMGSDLRGIILRLGGFHTEMSLLQEMSNSKAQHPDVQQRFDEGFRVIQRSSHLWAGLSSDNRF